MKERKKGAGFIQWVECPRCGNEVPLTIRSAAHRRYRRCRYCRGQLTAVRHGDNVLLLEGYRHDDA